jgi:hypothetical protein
MSRQCSGCGRIVDDPHDCREADEAEIKKVRDKLEDALRRVHAIPDTESSEIAGAIDELLRARIHFTIKRR